MSHFEICREFAIDLAGHSRGDHLGEAKRCYLVACRAPYGISSRPCTADVPRLAKADLEMMMVLVNFDVKSQAPDLWTKAPRIARNKMTRYHQAISEVTHSMYSEVKPGNAS